MSEQIIGGGAKKILYTLKTVRRMGLRNSAKALNSHNTCKACGLGMGGQRGGMTDELGEFPSVCNKSVQAQSTDVQPPIPTEIFRHSLADFRELSGHQLEHMGRLNTPLYKSADSDRYQPMPWDQALQLAGKRFANTAADRTFFYSSGRSSNEAGFVLQLMARLYGTNNVNNCSYYCHQATSVGLQSTLGTGTATVALEDLNHCDIIFVIGANPASNHPRFVYKLQQCVERGGQVVIINPAKEPGLVRFALPKKAKSLIAGGSKIATEYLQPRIGSDRALFKGIAKALIEGNYLDNEFIATYCTGFEQFVADITATDWQSLTATCGISQNDIRRIARFYGQANNAVFAWGMGITHHRHGVENVEAISNLALLRGMVGRPGAGLLPLRGHSNVQGIGTIGVKPLLAHDVIERIEKTYNLSLPASKGMDTLACLEAAHAGQIDAALLMGGNLYEATPDSRWAAEAFDRIPFKVFLTTTLNKGHFCGHDNSESLILPVTARDEEWQATTQESMFNFVRLSDGGITRLDNVRPETSILCDLASALLPSQPVDFQGFKNHRTLRQAIAASIPGLEALAEIDTSKTEFHIGGRLRHQRVFETPSGKAQFAVHAQPGNKAEDQHYPFTLASIRSEGQFNSIIYEEEDSYRGTKGRDTILMNSADIAELGIKPDARVSIKSTTGTLANVRVQAFDVPRNNILAYYPEANILISTERDTRSQTPAFKSVAVCVEVPGE